MSDPTKDEFRNPAEARAWERRYERRIDLDDTVDDAKAFAWEYIRGWREAMDPLEPPARRDLVAAIEVAAEEIAALINELTQALSGDEDLRNSLEIPERPNLAKFMAFAVMVRSKGPSA